MSILIKGASLPEDCPACPMAHWNACGSFTGCDIVGGKEYAMDDADYRNGVGRPIWCPLVEVPTPHGRLIDLDRLLEALGEGIDIDAPTVIEAEGE